MIIKNGIVYDVFYYRLIRSKNNTDKTTTEEIINSKYIDNELELVNVFDNMHKDVKQKELWYNDKCREWEQDGWKYFEAISGFVSLNQTI